MNNSKSTAISTLSTTTMAQFKADITVGMNDVVNVFVERYETDLINKRTSNQNKLKDLNKQIQLLANASLAAAKLFVVEANIVGVFDNPIFTSTISVPDKEFEVDWTDGSVTYKVLTDVQSKTIPASHYSGHYSDSIKCKFDIDQKDLDQYKDLMEQKTAITNVLGEININLRDVSRKERQVRAKLSEQKLTDMGMQDLLSNPEMLMLIDTTDVIG
jgi:hypothetical protein